MSGEGKSTAPTLVWCNVCKRPSTITKYALLRHHTDRNQPRLDTIWFPVCKGSGTANWSEECPR